MSKEYTSKDLARDVIKKRKPDDRATGGQSETDYSRGLLRSRSDRNNIQTGKGKNIPTLPQKWPFPVKKAKAV